MLAGRTSMSAQEKWIDALKTGEPAWADNGWLLNSSQTYTDSGKLCVLGYWLNQPIPMSVQLSRRQRIAGWIKSWVLRQRPV